MQEDTYLGQIASVLKWIVIYDLLVFSEHFLNNVEI